MLDKRKGRLLKTIFVIQLIHYIIIAKIGL